MKILFDYQIFCLQKYGGISRYFFELAEHITRTEHEVNIFAPIYINDYLSASSVLDSKYIKIWEALGMGKAVAWSADTVLARALLKSRQDINIYHETYYSGVDCCPRSAKRIVTIHDMIYEKLPDHFPGKSRMRKIRAQAISRADHVICVSENTRKDMVELLNVSEERTTVIHHGCSFGDGLNEKPLCLKKPYILFVGKRDGYKNFDILLHAYAHSLSGALSETHSLVCFGGGKFTKRELSHFSLLKLTPDNVMQISGDDNLLFSLYKGAEVFVYPSSYEGFGIPLLEAMASDCPVICSDSSSFPEVAGNAACYFEPNESDALGEAIEKVIFSTSFRDSLVQLGRERTKQFTWDRCTKETVKVYEQ